MLKTRRTRMWVAVVLALAVMAVPLQPGKAHAQEQLSGIGHFFRETNQAVAGAFWDYWQTRGGLAQQGYPISDEFTEVSYIDGKTYRVQYFERAVFELHPENQAPYDVLLSLLGTQLIARLRDPPVRSCSWRILVTGGRAPSGGGRPQTGWGQGDEDARLAGDRGDGCR